MWLPVMVNRDSIFLLLLLISDCFALAVLTLLGIFPKILGIWESTWDLGILPCNLGIFTVTTTEIF